MVFCCCIIVFHSVIYYYLVDVIVIACPTHYGRPTSPDDCAVVVITRCYPGYSLTHCCDVVTLFGDDPQLVLVCLTTPGCAHLLILYSYHDDYRLVTLPHVPQLPDPFIDCTVIPAT